MEWLLQKALESPGGSYSPQRVFELLNAHHEAIRNLTNFGTAILILWLSFGIFIILHCRRFNGRLKKLEGVKIENSDPTLKVCSIMTDEIRKKLEK